MGYETPPSTMKREGNPGSVSTGTLRTLDLIDAFSSELDSLDHRDTGPHAELLADALAVSRVAALVPCKIEAMSGPLGAVADEVLNNLFDALADYAPAGHYFGARGSAGPSDLGFWPNPECSEEQKSAAHW